MINRRKFLCNSAWILGSSMLFNKHALGDVFTSRYDNQALKMGLIPAHFPSALHAFVWRNWSLVPIERMAKTVEASVKDIKVMAKRMGLTAYKTISKEQWNRSYLTVIRRNWHLLPKEQLLILLGWSAEHLEFTLKEDDFFFVKLGNLKPECPTLKWKSLDEIPAEVVNQFNTDLKVLFPQGIPRLQEPYFQFVKELSKPLQNNNIKPIDSQFSPRIAYPYFALFGDSLLGDSSASYPDNYLARMANSGVDHIWMHIVLSKITPFPWDLKQSEHWEERLANLGLLAQRAAKKGIRIFLYLNEPRHQSNEFFKLHPDLQGAGNALCTSHPEVQKYLENSLAIITEQVPQLGGFFSITASENPTNCWSHFAGTSCKRCGPRGAGVVISELNNLYSQGIKDGIKKWEIAQSKTIAIKDRPKLIVWDWGWTDAYADEIIPKLNAENLSYMSVSEWDLEIERGGVKTRVGEYSISSIGPGPRAKRHWQIAKQYQINCIAKIQANNSWEIGAVPYIPALFNIGQHIENLRNSGVKGLMLGWSLGGYPSPNLEVVSLLGSDFSLTKEKAIQKVAESRFGSASSLMVQAWKSYSIAFSEFPYHGNLVYSAPLQAGPSNLLWSKKTNYAASMVGLPYDDINGWRAIYPVEIFIQQMDKVAKGFSEALTVLKQGLADLKLSSAEKRTIQLEMQVAEAITLHYQSVVNQSRFILWRDQLELEKQQNSKLKSAIVQLLKDELHVAKLLAELQSKDSRIGFEASNHYFYVPQDLYEKMLNCQYLIRYYS